MNETLIDVRAPITQGAGRLCATSPVSWAAIFAGAAAAAALSLILLILGVGLGLSSVSPWSAAGLTAGTFGIVTILWISITQILASGLGGYIAGRLRGRWADASSDEVFFRDTAHGMLSWAVASIATAALLTSSIGSIISIGIAAGGTAAASGAVAAGSVASLPLPGTKSGAASGSASDDSGKLSASTDSSSNDYFVDSLFRRPAAATSASPSSTLAALPLPTSEVGRIVALALVRGALPNADATYVSQLVSQHTGLSAADAEKRVADVYAEMTEKARATATAVKAEADRARKASAYASLWLFISLLIGAFVATGAATFGGRLRDQ